MGDFDYGFAAKLVKQAQQGDSDAFAELYTMTYQTQYQKARRYLRDDFLAQDALQEVYILALRNLEKLEQPKAFPAWLGQINFRVCYSMTAKRREESSIDEPEVSAHLPSREPSPEERAIQDSESRSLRSAVAALAPEDRRLLELRYGRGKTLEEVARETGLSLSSVKRHLKRACAALETMIEKR